MAALAALLMYYATRLCNGIAIMTSLCAFAAYNYYTRRRVADFISAKHAFSKSLDIYLP